MDIKTIIILGTILLLYLIIKAITTQHAKTNDTEVENSIQEYPYRQKYLLSKTEYAFYNELKKQCDEKNLLICPKVRMEDFIEVTDAENTNKYRGYIKSRHIDFIICDDKLRILAGLELDDNSHLTKRVQQTDEFKNQVFKAINLPLYRIRTTNNNIYENEIQKVIDEIKHD